MEFAAKNVVTQLDELRNQAQEQEEEFSNVVNSLFYQHYMENLQDEEYCILAPASRKELEQAGQGLHNCLGCYSKKINWNHDWDGALEM